MKKENLLKKCVKYVIFVLAIAFSVVFLMTLASANILSDATLRDRLVSYWSFDTDGTDSLNLNNLTFTGNASVTSTYALAGKSLLCGSGTAYKTKTASLNGSDDISIVFWVKKRKIGLWCSPMTTHTNPINNYAQGRGFDFQISESNNWNSNRFYGERSTGGSFSYIQRTGADFTNNTWEMWTIMVNATCISWWINATLFETQCTAAPYQSRGTDNYAICDGTYDQQLWADYIDEISWYNKTINISYLTDLYGGGTPYRSHILGSADVIATNLSIYNISSGLTSINVSQPFFIRANFTVNGVPKQISGNNYSCRYNSTNMTALHYVAYNTNVSINNTHNQLDLNYSYLEGIASVEDSVSFRVCRSGTVSVDLGLYINEKLHKTISGSVIPSCTSGFHAENNILFTNLSSTYFNISLRCPECNAGTKNLRILPQANGLTLESGRAFSPYGFSENMTWNSTTSLYNMIEHYHTFRKSGFNDISVNCNNTNTTLSVATGYIPISAVLVEIYDSTNGTRIFFNNTLIKRKNFLVIGDCRFQNPSENRFNISYSNGTIYNSYNSEILNTSITSNGIYNISLYCKDASNNISIAYGYLNLSYEDTIEFIDYTPPNNSILNINPLFFNFTDNFNATGCYLYSNRTISSFSIVNYTQCDLNITTNYTTNFSGVYDFTATQLQRLNFTYNNNNYSGYDDSIVVMFNFNNLSAIGESDSIAVDLSLHHYNGTINGTNFTTSGVFDGSVISQGTNAGITLEGTKQLGLSNKLTFVFWTKLISEPTDYIYLVSKFQAVEQQREFNIVFYSDKKIYLYMSDNGSVSGTHLQTIQTNNAISGLTQWNHFILIADGTNSKFFINGIDTPITVTNPITALYNKSNAEIRFFQVTGSGYKYDGYLDDFIMYNRSITTDEASVLFNASLKKINASFWNYKNTLSGQLCFVNDSQSANCTNTPYLTYGNCTGNFDSLPYHTVYNILPLDIEADLRFFVKCNSTYTSANSTILTYYYNNTNQQRPIPNITLINGLYFDSQQIEANIDVTINSTCENDTIIYSQLTVRDNVSALIGSSNLSLTINASYLNDGNYSVSIYCLDNATHSANLTRYFSIKDTVNPVLTWISPLPSNTTTILQNNTLFMQLIASDNNLFSMHVECFNPYLIKVLDSNVTITTGETVYSLTGTSSNLTIIGTHFCNATIKDSHTAAELTGISTNRDIMTEEDGENVEALIEEAGTEELSDDCSNCQAFLIEYKDTVLNVSVDDASDMNIIKKSDRYSFEPVFEDVIPQTVSYDVRCDSDVFVYLPSSVFPAHFVCGDLWIDFSISGAKKKDYEVIKDYDKYIVNIEYDEELGLETNSVGVVNTVYGNVTFNVVGAVGVSGAEPSSSSSIISFIIVFLWLGLIVIGFAFSALVLMISGVYGFFLSTYIFGAFSTIGNIWIVSIIIFICSIGLILAGVLKFGDS